MIRQISASAGSGKTYILTRRFIELLKSASPTMPGGGCVLGEDSREYGLSGILAATFTNKAAAEMRQRVVLAVKQEALDELADGRDTGQGLFWSAQILRRYGSLNIRTIDSLLTIMVRLSALELGLTPDFEPSFEPAQYFTPFYDALMDDLSADPAFLPGLVSQEGAAPAATQPPSFRLGDPAALRASLAEACLSLLHTTSGTGFTAKNRIRDQVQTLVERLLRGEPVPVVQSGDLHGLVNAMHSRAVACVATLSDLLEQEGLKLQANYRKFLDRCLDCPPYKTIDSAYQHKNDLDQCLLKASHKTASNEALDAFAKARDSLLARHKALPVLRHALQLAPLTALAAEIHARIKADSGPLLPALRLPGLAAGLLEGDRAVSDALCRFGTRIARLLLDEFQDTSREQWAAILPLTVECLATGGEFTYVGDVKQAIYGWRGGDAALFDQVLEEPELLAVSPRPIKDQLPANWRSHPVIVEHNNCFFSLLARPDVARQTLAAMLPPETPAYLLDEAAARASAIFASARQAIPENLNREQDPRHSKAEVVLYEAAARQNADVEQLVHDRLRRLVLEELLPNWRCGDIALLVRSGQEASLTASWLTDWGLPVVTENSFLLSSHPMIGRLISFLSFLEYPLDDLAFWEFASGPECLGSYAGLAPERLADWLALVRRNAPAVGSARSPLYALFRRDFAEVWEKFIAPFHLEAGLMSAYDVLKEAVDRFALLERTPDDAPFVRRLLEMACKAESDGRSSLSAFLAFWREIDNDEKIPLPEAMNAVRVMTMHKAKGLEFPVVILPFQHRGMRHGKELATLSFGGMDILTRTVPELGEPYYQACITDELERLNLLYVAWTRPVYALHAFVTRPQSRPTPLLRALETLLPLYFEAGGKARMERLEPVDILEAQQTALPAQETCGAGATKTEAGEADTAPAQGVQPLPSAKPAPPMEPEMPWRPMNWLPGLKIFRSPLQSPVFTARQRGILTHLCLEHLYLAPGKSDYRAEVGRAIRQALRLFALPVAEPESVGADIAASLLWFASLPGAPHWLLHGLREQSIMDSGGRLHRVDLVVDLAATPGGKNAMLVLDYKTGSFGPGPADGDAPATSELYEKQMRRYMDLMGEASGRQVEGRIIYLDERRIAHVAARDAK